jgi:hypothetical protein
LSMELHGHENESHSATHMNNEYVELEHTPAERETRLTESYTILQVSRIKPNQVSRRKTFVTRNVFAFMTIRKSGTFCGFSQMLKESMGYKDTHETQARIF